MQSNPIHTASSCNDRRCDFRRFGRTTLIVAVTAWAAATRSVSADPTYLQEHARAYGLADGLPSLDARAIVFSPSLRAIVVTTASGVARQQGERFEAIGNSRSAAFALAAAPDALYWVADDSVYRFANGEPSPLATLPDPAQPESSDLLVIGEEVYLVVEAKAYRIHAGKPEPLQWSAASTSQPGVRCLAGHPNGELVVAGASGFFSRRQGSWDSVTPHQLAAGRRQERIWALRDVQAVTIDSNARLAFACPQGVGVRRDDWRLYDAADGLPYADFTAAAFAPDGSLWLGTHRGAIRLEDRSSGATPETPPAWEYRQGRRWLPDDRVRAIATAPSGRVWFATPAGVSWIDRTPMTLAEKARHFEDQIDARHRRTPYGFVLGVQLLKQGDMSQYRQHDSDNDGLWTSMYGAGECFAWAATADPLARKRAQAAFRALQFLGQVTQGGSNPAPPGFVARTILPTSGRDPNTGQAERDSRMQETRDRLWKSIAPRWPTSADGEWYWKTDTSSDELDGHYFFYGVYYDLVAETEEERDAVRTVVAGLTDHLLAHDYALVDHDGKPTRWAQFGPEALNHDPDWWEERGLNSLSILSYLAVAEHVTGDEKYRAAADELIQDHAYAANVLNPKVQSGPGTGNQSDDEMAFMGFYSLLRYEDDPKLRQIYALSFRRYWQLEFPERNPLFHYLFAAVIRSDDQWRDAFGTESLEPTGPWREDSLDTLRRFPLSTIDWGLENSHRLDIRLLPDAGRGPRGAKLDGKVLPIDERFVEHWNHDPWRLDHGGNGNHAADGAAFLTPYYLGLYHGFIEKP